MKICENCKQEHDQPRSPLCVRCQKRRNLEKHFYKKAHPDEFQVKILSEEEKLKLRSEKAKEYYRKKKGLPLDYVPTYRASEPKPCVICSMLHNRPRAERCIKCERRIVNKSYEQKNRDKVLERQKKYREENNDKLKEIRRKCYYKYQEKNKQRSLDLFIKKKGLPLDYKRWKKATGEGNITSQGYRVITTELVDHPNAYERGNRMAEHTYVMIKHLGRPLVKGETVHHINGDRLDNRLENLELWHRSHPPGQRLSDKIKWCIDFLELYGYKVDSSNAEKIF